MMCVTAVCDGRHLFWSSAYSDAILRPRTAACTSSRMVFVGTDSRERTSGRFFRSLLIAVVAIIVVTQAGTVLGQISFGATLTVLRGTVSVVHGDGTAVSPAPSGLKPQA